MQRLTKPKNGKTSYFVEDDTIVHHTNGYSGEAVDKLARFENLCDNLMSSQIEIPEELSRLRNEGKEHTVKFKELMVKKLTNNNLLILLREYGICKADFDKRNPSPAEILFSQHANGVARIPFQPLGEISEVGRKFLSEITEISGMAGHFGNTKGAESLWIDRRHYHRNP